jgi:hypothetical protein
MSSDIDVPAYDPDTWGGLIPDTAGPLEREAMEKAKWALSLEALRSQIRRTDVEIRHLTGDKDLREFETQLLRVLTLSKQFQMIAMTLPILAAGVSGDPLALIYGGTMLGLIGTTSASVMQEVS